MGSRVTEWEGGDYIYLASVPLCEVHEALDSLLLFISAALWTEEESLLILLITVLSSRWTEHAGEDWTEAGRQAGRVWQRTRRVVRQTIFRNPLACDVCIMCSLMMCYLMYLTLHVMKGDPPGVFMRVTPRAKEAYLVFHAVSVWTLRLLSGASWGVRSQGLF